MERKLIYDHPLWFFDENVNKTVRLGLIIKSIDLWEEEFL